MKGQTSIRKWTQSVAQPQYNLTLSSAYLKEKKVTKKKTCSLITVKDVKIV